jgi:hypothetical protein
MVPWRGETRAWEDSGRVGVAEWKRLGFAKGVWVRVTIFVYGTGEKTDV